MLVVIQCDVSRARQAEKNENLVSIAYYIVNILSADPYSKNIILRL